MISLSTSAVVTEAAQPVRQRRELLTALPESGHFLLVIDNSSMERFVTCPRSALYYLLYEREAHARNAALTFGGAIHVGLEALLRGTDPDAAIRSYAAGNPFPPDEYRTIANAHKVVAEYATRSALPDYAWTLLSDANGPIIERPFELPLGVVPVGRELHIPSWDTPRFVECIHVAWSGRLDVGTHVFNRNRVTDHKTTSIDTDAFTQEFFLSNQAIGYVWAAQYLWPELDITGFCLNAIRLKRPTPGCEITARGPRGGEPALKFFRAYFDYTPERIVEWERNTIEVVADFIHCIERDYFPMHTKWCFGKYGKCPYHPVCSIEQPDVRLRFLLSEAYKQVTWDPTADR